MRAAPGDQIGRKAFERQARQILRRLLAPRAYLLPQKDGAYGLHTARSNAKPVMTCSADFISAMRAHDFLTATGKKLTASPTGAMWFRRASLKDKDIFRGQHQMRVRPVKESCEINIVENPLLWLSRRRGPDGKCLISAEQLQAASRLQNDFLQSTMRPRMTIDLTAPPANKQAGRQPHDGLLMNERALAARMRLGRALKALGPELAEITMKVCCHMRGLTQAENALGWPKRSGKIVLGIALTQLARHYHIIR